MHKLLLKVSTYSEQLNIPCLRDVWFLLLFVCLLYSTHCMVRKDSHKSVSDLNLSLLDVAVDLIDEDGDLFGPALVLRQLFDDDRHPRLGALSLALGLHRLLSGLASLVSIPTCVATIA